MKIGILGLGYVGLPLLIEFSKKYYTIGYDKNVKRLKDLNNYKDKNNELNNNQLKHLKKIKLTNEISNLINCNIFIVTVPTPVKRNKLPDTKPLQHCCLEISKILKKNDLVIFESTVYPGLTEDLCVKWLKTKNKLIYNRDFYCGYSPERINPGDKSKSLKNIVKITSGSTKRIANIVDDLYKSIISAGTYKAPSIQIAEAAKVIENCQRDINIAFVNELNSIFDKLNLDTNEVLKAASTKWNFLNFKPGLVGGHCVGVDPYYLIYKSKIAKHNPKLLQSARKINESVPKIISKNILKYAENNSKIKIIIFGFAFKENCNDIRNTKVFSIYNILKKTFKYVDIYDPIVEKKETKKLYGIDIKKNIKKNYYDLALLAVNHNLFKKQFDKKMILNLLKGKKIIYDYINLFK